jgi:integrase
MGHFFNLAIKYNYINKNPVSDVEKLKWQKKTPRFFSEEEAKLILENCGERLYPIFCTFLYTGLRKSELITLEWTDIDFKNKVIRVQIKDFWEPKFGSARVIPMNSKLYEVLSHLERKCRWVFCTLSGQQVRHLRRDLLHICERLGIKNVTLHTFRHTFASHLIMAGVDLPTVQKLMGHKDIKTTMIYSHLAPEHLKLAVEKLKI